MLLESGLGMGTAAWEQAITARAPDQAPGQGPRRAWAPTETDTAAHRGRRQRGHWELQLELPTARQSGGSMALFPARTRAHRRPVRLCVSVSMRASLSSHTWQAKPHGDIYSRLIPVLGAQ